MDKRYLFENVLDVAGFYIDELTIEDADHDPIEPFPLKVHEMLYITWAIYAATYGKNHDYPAMLFPADFAPSKFGPIVVKLEHAYHKNNIPKQTWTTIKSKMNLAKSLQDDVLHDIEMLLSQLEQTSMFTLISSSRHDKAFKTAEQEHTKLNPNSIIIEYDKLMEKYLNK